MLHIPSPTRQHGLSYRAECTVDLFLYTHCVTGASGPECPQASSCQMYVLSCHPPVGLSSLHATSLANIMCVHYPGKIHLYSVHTWGVLTGLSAPRWDATWNIQMQLKQLPL